MRWLVIVLLTLSFTVAQGAKKSFDKALVWPKEFKLGEHDITVFQPQVESLKEDELLATSAFKFTQDKKEYYGSFSIKGRALVDKSKNLVSLSQIKVINVQVPAAKKDPKELQAQLQGLYEGKSYDIPYRAVINNMQVQVSEGERPKPEIKNDVPKFFYVKEPAVLVMISGDPQWGESKGAKEVKRVINTSALILHEENKEFYLWALGKWYGANNLMGPYKAGASPSQKYGIIKEDLIKDKKIDPISGKTADGKSIYPPQINPEIIISTRPAELLQSQGEPQFQAIAGTALLYMSNSPNSIFLDSKTQDYYVLVTGRWFTAKNLTQGPYSYVPGRNLPHDFAKIGANSPVADALVSVPGTAQAKQAAIISNIPQMAKVDKSTQPKNIDCDGAQKWIAIQGTSLKYAENCNTPIIQVNEKQFYAIQDGVWFTSTSGVGPWTVAVAVPQSIYKIPSSSPIYYVTYVRVYDSNDQFVTVGYTPGYQGTFVSADGTIVYGTGYAYNSYTSGTTWYPAPATYGFGAGYGYGYDEGYYMGFSMGVMMSPWGWGTCCWGGYYPPPIHVTNIYTNWGKHTIVTGPGGGFNVNTIGDTKFARAHGSGEIYAGHDGQIYRRNPGGQWQQYQGPGAWDDINRKNAGELENLHQTRNVSERVPANSRPDRSAQQLRGGGGMRAGGGFHGGGFRR